MPAGPTRAITHSGICWEERRLFISFSLGLHICAFSQVTVCRRIHGPRLFCIVLFSAPPPRATVFPQPTHSPSPAPRGVPINASIHKISIESPEPSPTDRAEKRRALCASLHLRPAVRHTPLSLAIAHACPRTVTLQHTSPRHSALLLCRSISLPIPSLRLSPVPCLYHLLPPFRTHGRMVCLPRRIFPRAVWSPVQLYHSGFPSRATGSPLCSLVSALRWPASSSTQTLRPGW